MIGIYNCMTGSGAIDTQAPDPLLRAYQQHEGFWDEMKAKLQIVDRGQRIDKPHHLMGGISRESALNMLDLISEAQAKVLNWEKSAWGELSYKDRLNLRGRAAFLRNAIEEALAPFSGWRHQDSRSVLEALHGLIAAMDDVSHALDDIEHDAGHAMETAPEAEPLISLEGQKKAVWEVRNPEAASGMAKTRMHGIAPLQGEDPFDQQPAVFERVGGGHFSSVCAITGLMGEAVGVFKSDRDPEDAERKQSLQKMRAQCGIPETAPEKGARAVATHAVCKLLGWKNVPATTLGGTADRQSGIVMECVEGQCVHEYMKKNGLSPELMRELARVQILGFLVAHPDLNPTNLKVVEEHGKPAVKMLDSGENFGTKLYDKDGVPTIFRNVYALPPFVDAETRKAILAITPDALQNALKESGLKNEDAMKKAVKRLDLLKKHVASGEKCAEPEHWDMHLLSEYKRTGDFLPHVLARETGILRKNIAEQQTPTTLESDASESRRPQKGRKHLTIEIPSTPKKIR